MPNLNQSIEFLQPGSVRCAVCLYGSPCYSDGGPGAGWSHVFPPTVRGTRVRVFPANVTRSYLGSLAWVQERIQQWCQASCE